MGLLLPKSRQGHGLEQSPHCSIHPQSIENSIQAGMRRDTGIVFKFRASFLVPIISSPDIQRHTKTYQLLQIICYHVSICCKLPAHCQLHHHIFLLLQTESDQLVLKEDLILNVMGNL